MAIDKEKWEVYWRIGDDKNPYKNWIFWSKDEANAENHLPDGSKNGLNLGSGSLAIMNNKTFRWSEANEVWEEL